jgi:dihydrofolate reductase
MMISIIAAISKNRVIGNKNKLPWKLPADMQHFVSITKGKPVIMGRKTFESLGKPLPNRINIVLTSDKNYHQDGCVVVHDINGALNAAKEHGEVMVIGGAAIYEQFLPLAGRMYLTLIEGEFEGDAFFPHFNASEWFELESQQHKADPNNPYDYTFVTLERKIRSERGKGIQIRA